MRRSLPLAAHIPAAPLKSLIALALLPCAALCPWLPAQSSAPAPTATQNASAPPAATVPGALAFQPPNPFRSTNAITPEWSRTLPGPFDPDFGIFTGFQGGAVGFTGAANGLVSRKQDAAGFGAGGQGPGGFSRFGASGSGGRQNAPAPLFQIDDGLDRGLQGSANSPFAAAPAARPSFNQLMRGSLSAPASQSLGAFKFSYQDTFRPGASFDDLGRPYGSAIFTSPDLGNGVFFSAGTGYGSHSAGAPAATLGNGSPGAPKHSGSAVNLKLSF